MSRSFPTTVAVTLFVAAIVGGGCGPNLSERARDAYHRGDYLAAVALYDQALAANPRDAKAHVRRTEAQNAAFYTMLRATQRARTAGDADTAQTHLDRALTQRDAWRATLPPDLAPTLAFEIATAASYVETAVARSLDKGPFAAAHTLARHAALLRHTDFGGRHAALASTVRAAGHASCGKLASTVQPSSPYWTWLVDRACAHWGAARLAVPRLPHQLGDAEVTGAISGATDAGSAWFRALVAAAFRDSVWFAPDAVEVARISLGGHLAATFQARPISLSKGWIERVSYTEDESSSESYSEPYTDTETYTEFGETKTRTVTKHRTAHRTVTKSVTKHRDEQRTFHYQATLRDGRYTSELRARFEGPLRDLAPSVASSFTMTGVDHDTTFEQAKVVPSRANLMSFDKFVVREQGLLGARVAKALDEHYQRRYCTAGAYTLDTAAACAYLDPKRVPPPVHAALQEALGADEPFFTRALGR